MLLLFAGGKFHFRRFSFRFYPPPFLYSPLPCRFSFLQLDVSFPRIWKEVPRFARRQRASRRTQVKTFKSCILCPDSSLFPVLFHNNIPDRFFTSFKNDGRYLISFRKNSFSYLLILIFYSFVSAHACPFRRVRRHLPRQAGTAFLCASFLCFGIFLTLFSFFCFCLYLPLPTASPPPSPSSGDGLKLACFPCFPTSGTAYS